MKEKYLVLGASGFIGASLTKRLVEENKQIFGLIKPESNNWRLKDIKGVELVTGDIANKQDLIKKLLKINPTHIINLATYGVYRGQEDYQKILGINLTGSLNLFEAAKQLKSLDLLISTGSVYEYGSLPGQMEENVVAPARNFYDASKIAITSMAQAYSSLDILPICVLRPFTTYGPFEDSRRLIPSVVNMVKEGKNPRIAPEAIRDFIFIDDLVDAYILALQKPKSVTGQIINLGSGQPTKVKEFVSLVLTNLKTDIKPVDAPEFSSPSDSQCWSNIRKAKEIFKWEPTTSLEEGVKKTVDWHLNLK